eukprot:364567-Chlamydomonas_euryale.AAC.4
MEHAAQHCGKAKHRVSPHAIKRAHVHARAPTHRKPSSASMRTHAHCLRTVRTCAHVHAHTWRTG